MDSVFWIDRWMDGYLTNGEGRVKICFVYRGCGLYLRMGVYITNKSMVVCQIGSHVMCCDVM